jgi:hypothetical protein
MALHAAAARYQLGTLVGGEEGGPLVVKARAWLTFEGVRDARCMVAMIAPGFARLHER